MCLFGNERRLKLLRERRNKAYYRIRYLDIKLDTAYDPGEAEKLKRQLIRVRRTMRLAMESLSGVKLTPSNQQIASVLGIPKGTVDSSLYWLKKKLSPLYSPAKYPPNEPRSA